MVCYVTALCAPPTEPEPRQGCRAGEMRDSKQNCAPRTSHAIKKTLHKAGDMGLPQLKKPEQPSAEELGIREEIHWFRLFTHAQKAKHLFWCPLQEVSATRKISASGGGLVGHKVGHSWGKTAFPPRESLGAWTVLSVGRRNVLLLEWDSKKGQFWTVSEELQPLLVEGLRESSSTATSHVPIPSSKGPTRSFLCKEESAALHMLTARISTPFYSLAKHQPRKEL